VSYPRQVVGAAAAVVLDDRVWRAFGFKGLPRRGKFFDRFVGKEQLGKERFLGTDLLSSHIALGAQHVFARKTKSSQARLAVVSIELLMEQDRMAGTLGFESVHEARDRLIGGLCDYLSGTAAYETIFLHRGRRFLGRAADVWVVSAVTLFTTSSTCFQGIEPPRDLSPDAMVGEGAEDLVQRVLQGPETVIPR
jgi:hypothetical protein